MGWRPIFSSWMLGLPSLFSENETFEIELLFHSYIDSILYWIRHHASEISPTQDQNLV